jgi:hypothetical protein
MEYIIRECTEEDLPKLVELCGKHSEFEQTNYASTGKEILLKKALFSDRSKLFCFVIESSNNLQGYFSYTLGLFHLGRTGIFIFGLFVFRVRI